MKRWIRFAAVCLILGAIVNTVLAWWITATDTSQWTWGGYNAPPDQAQSEWWSANAPAGFSSTSAYVTSKPKSGVWTEIMLDQPMQQLSEDEKESMVERRRAGWPFKSLQGHRWVHATNPSLNRNFGTWKLFQLKPWLPLQPMWPGFFANSALFGLVPLLPIAAFASARRHIRRRRHQCLHCGYPIGTSPVCTECGRSVARPSAP